MNKRTADMIKINKVINSCVTLEQLNVAHNMIVNFHELYFEPNNTNLNFTVQYICDDLFDNLKSRKREINA